MSWPPKGGDLDLDGFFQALRRCHHATPTPVPWSLALGRVGLRVCCVRPSVRPTGGEQSAALRHVSKMADRFFIHIKLSTAETCANFLASSALSVVLHQRPVSDSSWPAMSFKAQVTPPLDCSLWPQTCCQHLPCLQNKEWWTVTAP